VKELILPFNSIEEKICEIDEASIVPEAGPRLQLWSVTSHGLNDLGCTLRVLA
jgi:hypothetical protein